MAEVKIGNLAQKRVYDRLEQRAQEYLKTNDWSNLLDHIKYSGSEGKSRDALVSLLELEALGGTDTEVFKEFSDLDGKDLHQIRANAVEHAIEILKEQIENRHTYFLDVEAMAETPYAILAKEVIEARKNELAQLESNPSRIDVLGTYYGFMILMIDGSQPHDNSIGQQSGYRYWRRRTWLDERITDSAASAIKRLTGEFAQEVDMDKTYQTLGSSQIFKSRCLPKTAEILANAVRLSLYKVPGNRSSAAVALGRTEDARVLPVLHHRMGIEQSREVKKRIARALGRVGHTDSLEILREQVNYPQRNLSKEQDAIISAIGGIFSLKSKEILLAIMEKSGNTVKGAAIRSLGTQDPEGLVEIITPYLKDKSRPVVRASVLALTELGDKGHEAIIGSLPVVLKRIGDDKPSQVAVSKILQIPNVSQKRFVQEFFAERIYKLRKDAEYWKQRTGSSSYSWWYRRREQRAQRNIVDVIKLVNRYLQPPFQIEILNSVEAALKVISNPDYIIRDLNNSTLARALISQQSESPKKKPEEVTFEQMYFAES